MPKKGSQTQEPDQPEEPPKDERNNPPAEEGTGIQNDRYTKSDSAQPDVKKKKAPD